MKRVMVWLLQVVVLFSVGFFGMGAASSQWQQKVAASNAQPPAGEVGEDKNDTTKPATTKKPAEAKPTESKPAETKPKETKKKGTSTKNVHLTLAKTQELTPLTIEPFLSNQSPVLLLIGTQSNFDDLAALLAELEQKESVLGSYYWIDMDATEFAKNEITLTLADEYVMSISPAIYYLQKKQVFHHVAFRRLSDTTLVPLLKTLGVVIDQEPMEQGATVAQ